MNGLGNGVNGQKPAVASDGIIYYMNGQSIEALAFRVVRHLRYFLNYPYILAETVTCVKRAP